MTSKDEIVYELNADFIFSKTQDEKVDFIQQDLIELKPYGMSLHNDTTRPFLLLKDDSGRYTLPVGINQIEAGVTLTQSSTNHSLGTPHTFSEKLLNSLDIKIDRCIFVEISGHHQYVRVYMSGHPRHQSLKLKAEDAMSLCLHLKVPFYASASFIQRSKTMTAEVSESAKKVLNHTDHVSLKKQYH
jgi:bifunctional DNase/RNase